MTNHGHVLAYLYANPDARLREIAVEVGITERSVAHIVGDLEEAGYLTKTRVGRRNRYKIQPGKKIESSRVPPITVGQLVGLLAQALGRQPFT